IALAYDSPAVTVRELRFVLRVALDCLPLIRHRVIAALVQGAIAEDADGHLSTSAIAGAAQFSSAAIRRALEDIQALDLVVCHKTGTGKADTWALTDEWVPVFQRLCHAGEPRRDGGADTSEEVPGTVSERFGGASHADGTALEEGTL